MDIKVNQQSDWNQNDSSKPGYVKNRTHYISQEEVTETLLDNENIGQDCNSYAIGETAYSFTGFYNGYAPTAEDEGKLFRVSVTDYDGRVLCDNLEVRAQVMSVPQENDGTVEFVEQVCIPFHGDPTLTNPTGLAAGFSANSQLFFVSNLNEYDPYNKQDFTVTLIKVIQEEEVQKLDEKFLPENIQSDWNQSDSTQIDYVKNRTHWKEEGTVTKLFANGEADGTMSIYEGIVVFDTYSNIVLTEDSLLNSTITFDGEVITLTEENRATDLELMDGEWYFDGEFFSCLNGIIWSETDITFNVLNMESNVLYIGTQRNGTEVEYSFSLNIGGVVYHKLEQGYVDTDWDENDSSSVSYIKNRTHWKEYIVQDQLTLNLENYDELSTDNEVAIYKNIRLTENALIGSTITYHHIVDDSLVTDTYTLTEENRIRDAASDEEFWWFFGTLYDFFVYIYGISPDEIEQDGLTEMLKSATIYTDTFNNKWGDIILPFSSDSVAAYSFVLQYRGEDEYQEFSLNAINEYTYHKLDENYLPENIQADWNQNDDTQIDYIENRTHYEYSENIYPGDDDISENGYFRISDSIDTLSGNKLQLRVLSSGSVVDCSAIYESFWRFNISDGELGAILYVDLENGNESNSYEYVTVRRSNVKYILNVKSTSTIDDVSFEPGIYVKDDDTYMFGVSLPQVKKLDEKYLPETTKYQSDWNQNDESATDYIKNRICYEGESTTTHYDIFEIPIVNGAIQGQDPNMSGYYFFNFPEGFEPKEGETYTMHVKDKEAHVTWSWASGNPNVIWDYNGGCGISINTYPSEAFEGHDYSDCKYYISGVCDGSYYDDTTLSWSVDVVDVDKKVIDHKWFDEGVIGWKEENDMVGHNMYFDNNGNMEDAYNGYYWFNPTQKFDVTDTYIVVLPEMGASITLSQGTTSSTAGNGGGGFYQGLCSFSWDDNGLSDAPNGETAKISISGNPYFFKNTYAKLICLKYHTIDPNYSGVIGWKGTGANSVIFNYKDNVASGSYSFAEGYNTTASAYYSHSEGNSTETSGQSSHAEGNYTKALGVSAHSEGNQTISYGNNSHAEGSTTVSSGKCSHAEGCGDYISYQTTKVNSTTLTVNGDVSTYVSCLLRYSYKYYTITNAVYDSQITTITITPSIPDTDSSNYLYIYSGATGDYSHSEGLYTFATGSCSHAEGNYTRAFGVRAHAEGRHSEAIGADSHAEGGDTTASGIYSHAEGGNTTASGNHSHAEGGNTTASGIYSHAEGGNTTASGNHSHAEGSTTIASAYCSHTEGDHSKASGNSSHAEGYYTEANGENSHVEGRYTIASSSSQHVFGEYNIDDDYKSGISDWVAGTSYEVGDKVLRYNSVYQCKTANSVTTWNSMYWDNLGSKGEYIEIVGNGNSTTRSNARTLDWDGNEVLAGSLTIGGTLIVNGQQIEPQAQSDWNQSDNAASDYIKNRTHYTETESVTYMDEDFGSAATQYFDFSINIVDGETYTMTVTGSSTESFNTTEELTAADDGSGNIVLRNSNMISITLWAESRPSAMGDHYGAYNGPGNMHVNVSQNEETVVQLDDKYISDNIARVSDFTATNEEINEIVNAE